MTSTSKLILPYRVLHNSLPFLFPKSFVWLCLVVTCHVHPTPLTSIYLAPPSLLALLSSLALPLPWNNTPGLLLVQPLGISVGTQSMAAHHPIFNFSITLAAPLLLVIRPSQFLSFSID
jgi:hypothetical protein